MSPPAEKDLRAKPSGRLGSNKSKTGCLTCKARKVKCDETKPECRRCKNAGRTCQGYIDVFVTTQVLDRQHGRDPTDMHLGALQLLTPPRTPSPVPADARAMHYYQVRVAGILGGAVDQEFWTRSVLQLSEGEPAIKQALIAVSDLWEVQVDQHLISTNDAQRRHIEMYNKALMVTARRVAEPQGDIVALATCVLFLCLHCLRGDKEQAIKLLQSGSGVMQKVMQSLYNPNGSAETEAASIFLPIFERLIVLLRLFGEYLPHFRPSSTLLYNDVGENISRFDSLDDARGPLYWLIAESHELIVRTRFYRWSSQVNDLDETALRECVQKQGIQLAAYAAWLEAFDQLCESLHGVGKLDEYYSANLRLTHTIVVIWLSTCLDRKETTFDKYLDSFRNCVREAEIVISRNKEGSPPFTFEMGVIPPLYLTILKCRDLDVRCRALAILEQAPAREGLWNRSEALRVVRRVVELESGSAHLIADGAIFERARMCDCRTEFTDAKGTHIRFSAKQEDHEELWLEWDEVLPLEDDAASSPQSHMLFTQAGVP